MEKQFERDNQGRIVAKYFANHTCVYGTTKPDYEDGYKWICTCGSHGSKYCETEHEAYNKWCAHVDVKPVRDNIQRHEAYQTRTGRVLTAEEIDRLADEAEIGYTDVLQDITLAAAATRLCALDYHAWTPWLQLANGSYYTYCVRQGCEASEQYDVQYRATEDT